MNNEKDTQLEELLKLIAHLREILGSEKLVFEIIKEELLDDEDSENSEATVEELLDDEE